MSFSYLSVRSFICAFGVFIGSICLSFGETAKLLEERNFLIEELKKHKPEQTDEKKQFLADPTMVVRDALNRLLGPLENSDRKMLGTWLDTYAAAATQLPSEFQEKYTAFLSRLRKHLKSLEDEKIKELNAFLAEMKDGILGSETPEELDQYLARVQQKVGSFDYYKNHSKELQRLSKMVSSSKQVLSAWQDYLIAESTQNSSGCKRALERVSGYLVETPIIPRSYVLKLLHPNEVEQIAEEKITEGFSADRLEFISLPKILDGFKEDLNSVHALDLIQQLPTAQQSNRDVEYLKRDLQKIDWLEKSVAKDTFAEIANSVKRLHLQSRDKEILFSDSLNRILCLALNLKYPELAVENAWSQFTAARWVRRWFLEAIENKDWELCLSLIEDLKILPNTPSLYSDISRDSEGLRKLILAIKAESSGQLSMAIKSYRSAALQFRNTKLLDVALSALKRLKEEYPDEFIILIEKADRKELLSTMERLLMAEQDFSRRSSRGRGDIEPALRKVIREQVEALLLKERAVTIDEKVDSGATE